MKIEIDGDEIVLRLKRKDPLVKEIAKALKAAGRDQDCEQVSQAAEEEPPPEIPPGG